MNLSLIKRPSGFLPIVMSLVALSLVLEHYARVGIVHEPDEVTEAHLFQLLMAAQVPVIAFFAVSSLSRAPRQGIPVLALQAAAAIAAFAGVYFLT